MDKSRKVGSKLKDSTEIKLGFKKVWSKFINDNERSVFRKVNSPNTPLTSSPIRELGQSPKLSRNAVGSKSSPVLPPPQSPRKLSSPRTSYSKAIALEAYQSPEISPRDILRLRRTGKSAKDLNNAILVISPRLNRNCQHSESELLIDINRQLNNLRGDSFCVNIKKFVRKRRNTI